MTSNGVNNTEKNMKYCDSSRTDYLFCSKLNSN